MSKPRKNIDKSLVTQNLRIARLIYAHLPKHQTSILRDLTTSLHLSLSRGELLWIQDKWYVSHSGLLRIAHRGRCMGISTCVQERLTEPSSNRWVFKATVYKSLTKSFDGYGDADPSNVSALVQGAEMRVAETRAVNRALRKAYGIGICSVEEIGSFDSPLDSRSVSRKLSQPADSNGNYGGRTVRDRLCQLIHQHRLDATLVKSYATDFCGVQTLREATREQIEGFVAHLADWAEKDRSALLCQLNSYGRPSEGAA
jgi:hypothetical protein